MLYYYSILGKEAKMVQEVRYIIRESFARATFDSCKGVTHPATSGSVLGLMCGRWGDRLCAPRRWFDFMGSTANGVSPFDIHYYYATDDEVLPGFQPHLPQSYSCHQKVGVRKLYFLLTCD